MKKILTILLCTSMLFISGCDKKEKETEKEGKVEFEDYEIVEYDNVYLTAKIRPEDMQIIEEDKIVIPTGMAVVSLDKNYNYIKTEAEITGKEIELDKNNRNYLISIKDSRGNVFAITFYVDGQKYGFRGSMNYRIENPEDFFNYNKKDIVELTENKKIVIFDQKNISASGKEIEKYPFPRLFQEVLTDESSKNISKKIKEEYKDVDIESIPYYDAREIVESEINENIKNGITIYINGADFYKID